MSDITPEERRMIFNEFGGCCGYCGTELDSYFHVDHIVPKNKGGDDCMSNYRAACIPCNLQKSTLTVEQFRAALLKKHKQLLRDDARYRALFRYGIIEKKKSELIFHFEKSRLV